MNEQEIVDKAKWLLTHQEIKKYYENGQIKQHYFTKDGKLDGEYKAWNKDGELVMNLIYKPIQSDSSTAPGMLIDSSFDIEVLKKASLEGFAIDENGNMIPILHKEL